MHKIEISLTDEQYKALETVSLETGHSSVEEFADTVFKDWIAAVPGCSKEDDEADMDSINIWEEEDETYPTIYEHDGIYCDGDMAVIEDITLQRIEGSLYYVINTPYSNDRKPVHRIAAEQFEKILEKHGAVLNDHTWEDLRKPIAGAGYGDELSSMFEDLDGIPSGIPKGCRIGKVSVLKPENSRSKTIIVEGSVDLKDLLTSIFNDLDEDDE